MISLDAIAAGLDLDALSAHEIASVLCRLSAAQTRIAARLSAAPSASSEDHLVDVNDAARRLAVDPQWLYRRTKRLPFVVRMGGQVRYSTAGITRYIAKRNGGK